MRRRGGCSSHQRYTVHPSICSTLLGDEESSNTPTGEEKIRKKLRMRLSLKWTPDPPLTASGPQVSPGGCCRGGGGVLLQKRRIHGAPAARRSLRVSRHARRAQKRKRTGGASRDGRRQCLVLCLGNRRTRRDTSGGGNEGTQRRGYLSLGDPHQSMARRAAESVSHVTRVRSAAPSPSLWRWKFRATSAANSAGSKAPGFRASSLTTESRSGCRMGARR